MSKFYEETMQSLLQVVEISKGTIPVAQVNDVPAKTYRAVTDNTRETVATNSKIYGKFLENTSLA